MKVVVTGMGAVTPIGNDVKSFWHSLRNGESGVNKITRFDTKNIASDYAAEVKDFNVKARVDKRDARKMDIFSQYAAYASLEAWENAGLHSYNFNSEKAGVVLGNGVGGFQTIEESIHMLIAHGMHRVPPMSIPKLIANIGPAHIAILLGLHGPVYTVTTACSSATDAIGNAMRHIRDGMMDIVVTGGVEAAITPLGVSGFSVIHALSTNFSDQPQRASRPFDKQRDGFVIGEGAGILILESEEHAKARGAHIYAEIAGHGFTNDAYHITAPSPDGKGAARAMKMALEDAKIGVEDIDYINAHGTSTQINDPVETEAIKSVFGERAYKLFVSSTKSMTGHCIGGAGGVEAIASILAINNNYVPPTINLEDPDERCDLNYVPQKGKNTKVCTVMSNTLGFGGHNGVLVIREYH